MMRVSLIMSRKYLIGILLCLGFVQPGLAQTTDNHSGRRIDLMECIETALDANFSLRIAHTQVEMAKNNVSLAPFLPTLSATARQSQTLNNNELRYADGSREQTEPRTDAYSLGATLSWRLFDGLAMFTSYDRQKELLASGELDFKAKVEDLVSQVSSQYYTIITIQHQVGLLQQLLETSRLRYEQALLKHSIGTISGVESQQARVYFNADSSSLMIRKEDLSNAYITLYKMLNIPLDSKLNVQDTIIPNTDLNYDMLRESALRENTSLQLMRQGRVLAEHDFKLSRAARYPKLDFSTTYNLSQNNTPQSNLTRTDTKGFNWGFTFSVPIFSGFSLQRQVKNARLEVDRVDLQVQQAEQNLLGTLLQSFNTYTNNVQMIDFETVNAEAAYANMDAAVEMYRLGEIAGIEFRDIQISYLNAVDRKLRAIYQAKLSEISLLLLAGSL